MTEKVELTPELLRELQLKQLDMLVYFRDFCEKNLSLIHISEPTRP